MGWRYIASRLNGDGTETILDWNLPLAGPQITNTLSGPDRFRATVEPEVMSLKSPDGGPILEAWSTAIYSELDGHIRSGCILTDVNAKGETLRLTGAGFSGYPTDMPWTDENKAYVSQDPAIAFRDVWTHLQSKPGGDLGLQVNIPSTPARTGTRLDSDPNPRNETTGRYEAPEEPRALELRWDKTFDLGDVISDIVRSTPLDYVEQHTWTGERTIKHELRGGYPRLGRRRDDLRFVVGENVGIMPDARLEDGEYASEVVVLGAGEGSKMVRAHGSRRNKRLRRVALLSDRSITTAPQAQLLAKRELDRRTGDLGFTELMVIDHPHAPVGSYALGDEIFLQTGTAGWQGDISRWLRIVAITYSPEDMGVAALSVVPAPSS